MQILATIQQRQFLFGCFSVSNKPWYNCFQHIKQRCNNPNSGSYKYYGGKGIKCLLTLKGVEFLWNRDEAWKLKNPSIDRKNSKDHYTLKNCRFIELSENSARASRKPVLQYDLEGKIVARYPSIKDASATNGLNYNTLKGYIDKPKMYSGYIWKFKQ